MKSSTFQAVVSGQVLLCLCLFGCDSDDDSTDVPSTDSTPGELENVCRPQGDSGCADKVVDAPGETGVGNGIAALAVNGVRGCGEGCGSLDVFSLGLEAEVDNYITLRWSDRRVTNGPGTDFVVFENPFTRDGADPFLDAAVIYLSEDGQQWIPYPHDYTASDETTYFPEPEQWDGFAGLTPVLLNEEENLEDPFDLTLAGGDHFDLDLLSDDPAATRIKNFGFVYLKIVSAPSILNPDTGDLYVKDAISNGADIDGVYARYLQEDSN